MNVEHICIAGDDVANRGRHERRRAQVDCARLVLERSAALLLTSTKVRAKDKVDQVNKVF